MFVFFNDTATTEIYTLSLHDALPIWLLLDRLRGDPERGQRGDHAPHDDPGHRDRRGPVDRRPGARLPDRKSTRLNSSHANISYAVFCLKKKKTLVTPY